MQKAVAAALVIFVSYCCCYSCCSQPIASASLSPSGTWVPLCVMAILGAKVLITLGVSPNPGLSTCSAGRAKKAWGRCWEGVVAMGVAREAQPH